MTITFKDASAPPKKTRPLTYADLKPGDVFRFFRVGSTLLKTGDGHVFFGSGNVYPATTPNESTVHRLHVTATIDRVESEVEE